MNHTKSYELPAASKAANATCIDMTMANIPKCTLIPAANSGTENGDSHSLQSHKKLISLDSHQNDRDRQSRQNDHRGPFWYRLLGFVLSICLWFMICKFWSEGIFSDLFREFTYKFKINDN